MSETKKLQETAYNVCNCIEKKIEEWKLSWVSLKILQADQSLPRLRIEVGSSMKKT